jgi:hypothetical protein
VEPCADPSLSRQAVRTDRCSVDDVTLSLEDDDRVNARRDLSQSLRLTMSGTCRCGAAPGCSATPVPPIHPGHSPTVHRHHRFLLAARLRLVHGFGA